MPNALDDLRRKLAAPSPYDRHAGYISQFVARVQQADLWVRLRTDGREALVAGDPDTFAERVERLVHDANLRARLRDEGWAYLEKHHSPAIAQRVLRTALGLD